MEVTAWPNAPSPKGLLLGALGRPEEEIQAYQEVERRFGGSARLGCPSSSKK